MKKFTTFIVVLGVILACSMYVHAEPSPSGKPTYDKNPNISESTPNKDENTTNSQDSEPADKKNESTEDVQGNGTVGGQNKTVSKTNKTTGGKKSTDKATSKTNEPNITNDNNDSILRPVQETVSPETGKNNRGLYELGIAAAFFAFSAVIIKKYKIVGNET